MANQKTRVQNVNHPDYEGFVDTDKYEAAKTALLAILPTKAPGLTQSEMMAAIAREIDQTLFPGGQKSGWWMKTVQLDLEAKGVITRTSGKPLRWHHTS